MILSSIDARQEALRLAIDHHKFVVSKVSDILETAAAFQTFLGEPSTANPSPVPAPTVPAQQP